MSRDLSLPETQLATVIAWHRRGFRLFWTWKSRHRTGRPTVPADVRELIRTMSQANWLWGAPCIHGELQKLGIAVAQATSRNAWRVASDDHRRRPGGRFLANHIGQVMAADSVVVPTATYRLLFVLVILAHKRRRIVHVRSPITRLPPGRRRNSGMPFPSRRWPLLKPMQRTSRVQRAMQSERRSAIGGSYSRRGGNVRLLSGRRVGRCG
jgi:hypothetical protein